MSSKITAFVYGILSSFSFLAALLHAVGVLGNFIVPKSIESGSEGSFDLALIMNGILLGFFAVQHSVMARRTDSTQWIESLPSDSGK